MELLINEKDAALAYETIIKILEILKGPCAKGCYLIQNFKLAIGRCICPSFLAINFFSHNLTCYEGCVWDTYFSGFSYLQPVEVWKKKYCPPFQLVVQVFISNSMPWRRNSSKLLKSWPLFHTLHIFYLLIISNLHTPWQMFSLPDL